MKLLQEDETFRNEVRILLLKDIDLDLLKEQIEELKKQTDSAEEGTQETKNEAEESSME